MGILERIRTVLKSNINALISKAEDPEKMLNQLVMDMNEQLLEAKKQVAMSIADEKKLERQMLENRAQGEDWEKKAMLAVKAGKDDLAKEALTRKQEYDGYAASFQKEFESQHASVEQLKDGRKGLELYRGLVERVNRQVAENTAQCERLEAQAKAYLKAGDRETAAKFALELQKARKQAAENKAQLDLHEGAYQNNLKKIQHANEKLIEVRQKIQKYDAELRMSEAEAEIAKLSESFDMNVTTDFGQIEQVIQQRIDVNRGKARVASDLSSKGVAEIEAEEKMEKVLAEDALQALEAELGLKTPETTSATEATKDLGPAVEKQTR